MAEQTREELLAEVRAAQAATEELFWTTATPEQLVQAFNREALAWAALGELAQSEALRNIPPEEVAEVREWVLAAAAAARDNLPPEG